jgi:hypothetical protein
MKPATQANNGNANIKVYSGTGGTLPFEFSSIYLLLFSAYGGFVSSS